MKDDILPKKGPSNLDIECKASLQQILRPSNYGVINPWMESATIGMKRDMVQLAKMVKSAGERPVQAPVAMTQVIAIPSGRQRAANVVPVSADRAQADLLRNRSGSDARDVALQAERQYCDRYARIPSTGSVADFYRLKNAPVQMEPSTKVLTDLARARLQQWQVHGPEADHHVSAEIMRSLRSIASAVERLPTYADHRISAQPTQQGLRDSLYEYSKTTSMTGSRILKEKVAKGRVMAHSSSAPAVFRPVVSEEDVSAITRPGGYVVKLMDQTPLQMLKNKSRSAQSQVQMTGGGSDWKTTYGVMASRPDDA
eukprot:CAMPEP_0197657120 /NCGR_PEP_ID=MMETSP1338-20131121/44436_1 /TAXON_ID=43686 ORGANISM="Pelagodinium beii, Strain RCC1491" /NCGR_SAMPLE_ID=MMETSP1338 /ASSEMBLY_ACC=CAM_ASM_000754 /LENGTH=312 /DNA_ID=CAMNT_0043233425 /DNA_START=125 /DNA_END=1063 /DNA_ORIENTATION=-